jgi:hypothetical protein
LGADCSNADWYDSDCRNSVDLFKIKGDIQTDPVLAKLKVHVYATGLVNAKTMAVAQENAPTVVYVGFSTTDVGFRDTSNVYYILDSNSDGSPEHIDRLFSADGQIRNPYGVAISGKSKRDLLIAGTDKDNKGVVWWVTDASTTAENRKVSDKTDTA